jgi:DNA helicase-2/ATP-dependent DNA helicase PcrA
MSYNQFMSKSTILDGLNKEQEQAVIHKTGPLLIVAGAGTGKTTVITRRIAYLIEQKIAKSSEILALTFTEKAAAEMEERVDMLVPYGYTDMWISTFHAFGDRLLRDYALDLGLPVNFKVLSKVEQAIFMRQHIYAFELKHYRPIASPLSHIDAMLTLFSRLKDELISPEEYLASAEKKILSATGDDRIESEKQLELAQAYKRYQELMIQAGNLDYGDQIYLTYELLQNNPKVLGELQERFKYILVDEYQDTNFAQNEIVKLLASKYQNITVVGDDDQSIYRFRGASISNILEFKKNYNNTSEVVLNTNYRSTREILDASYRLIINNNPDRLEVQNKINKKLDSDRTGSEPELLYSDTLSCEADSLVAKIKELKAHGLKNNEIAILIRANSHAEPFIQSLNVAGIPHVFSGASGLYDQTEVKMLVALLKCLVYSDDNLAFHTLALSPLYGVSEHELTELYTNSRRLNRPAESFINDSSSAPLKEMALDINKYRARKSESAGELLYDYLNKKKYLKMLSADLNIENELRISHIAKFFEKISQFNHSSIERGVLPFLESLELILEVGDDKPVSDIDPDFDAINILTVHAAKGLEWPAVFIVNCVAERFPSRNKREALPIPDDLIKERLPEGDFHLQEERRLFYVATTRAKDFLYLTAAEDYGGKRTKKLSPFVLELLGEPKADKLKVRLSPMEKIERFKKLPTELVPLPAKFQEKILRLSRQQIDDYYTCPKKFYFTHVVKIPLLENHYLMYGTAIHSALDRYFSRKIRGEKPKLEQLLADYEEAFRNVGFITRDQEEERFRNGLDVLSRFYETDKTYPRSPSNTEELFEFAEGDIKVNGRYDLIFGVGESAEICDFKTTDLREQKDADRRIKDSTQMKIYALAWYEKYGIIPKTTLYFLEPGIKGEITFKEDDLEKTKELVLEAAGGIRSNKMPAKPDHQQCKWCAYKDLCPEAA